MSNLQGICVRYGALSALVLSLVAFSGCELIWPSADLPNGYKLREFSNNQIKLFGPDGRQIYSQDIGQFMIVSGFVYGDLGENYFCLDTSTGVTWEFATRKEFDLFCRNNGLPTYDMFFSYTFWDLEYRHKRWQDETLSRKPLNRAIE